VAPTPSIRVIKSFGFKGGTRLYSNRYHFLGGTPADATHWHTLMDNVTTAEHLALTDIQSIVEAVGYAAGSDVPVATKTYALPGARTVAAGRTYAPGEVAGLVRFSTNAMSTKNHPIYCFNYYHGVTVDTAAGSQDLWAPDQTAVMATYAAAWIAGFSDGTITATRASPAGHSCTGAFIETHVTHRDFPYSRSA
jgi:hypothetical protein